MSCVVIKIHLYSLLVDSASVQLFMTCLPALYKSSVCFDRVTLYIRVYSWFSQYLNCAFFYAPQSNDKGHMDKVIFGIFSCKPWHYLLLVVYPEDRVCIWYTFSLGLVLSNDISIDWFATLT